MAPELPSPLRSGPRVRVAARAASAVAWLALASITACRDPSTRSTEVGAVAAAASESAPAASTPLPPAVTPSPFAIVARLSARVDRGLHRLDRHVALWQRSRDEPYAWSLTTIAPDATMKETTKRLRTRIRDDAMEFLFVAGSGPDDMWIVTSRVLEEGAMAFDLQTWRVSGGSLEPTNQPGYRFVGEFRKGQWVGVPFAIHPGYLLDDPPRTFRTLSGKGAPPKLPAKFSLFEAAFLGEQRACGLGAHVGESVEMALWLTEPGGMRVFPLGPLDQEAHALAAGEECVVVHPGARGTTFRRVRGDTLTDVAVAERASVASGSADGALWIVHDGRLARVSMTEDAARAHDVSLPRAPACSGPLEVTSVAARTDDDVWILAGCDAEAYLLHTQAASPASVLAVPAP